MAAREPPLLTWMRTSDIQLYENRPILNLITAEPFIEQAADKLKSTIDVMYSPNTRPTFNRLIQIIRSYIENETPFRETVKGCCGPDWVDTSEYEDLCWWSCFVIIMLINEKYKVIGGEENVQHP